MSGNFVGTIKFTGDKTCGVQLNNFPLGHNLDQGSTVPTQTVVKLVADNLVTGYFGLSLLQQSNHLQKQNNHDIFINGLYANKIGFRNDSDVSVEVLHNVPACVQACIEPVTIDDWEILELHADQVESSLLDQIRVIWPNQVFPLWVDRSICIFMRTVKIEPFLQCAVLIPLTELIVEPKVAERPYFVENRNESFLSDHEMDLKKYDVSASSSSTPTDSISQRQKLYQRFLQLTAVRKFMKLIAYLMNLLWNRIIPSIRSSLAFFNFFSSTAMPVTASDKEKYQTLQCIEDFPENFDVVFRVEPMSERDVFNFKRCYNNVHNGDRWNFVDDTGALFCGEPRCVLMQTDTKTAEEKYFKKTENEIPVLDQAQSGSENYESSLFCDPGYFIVSLQKLPFPSERDVKPGPVEKNNPSTSLDNADGNEKKLASENIVRLCVHAFSRFAQMFKRKSEGSTWDTELHPLKISAQLRQQLRIGTSSRVRIKKVRSPQIETTIRIKKIVFQLLDDYSDRKWITVERITYSLEQWMSLITDSDHPLPVTVGSILCIPWKLQALWDGTDANLPQDRDLFLEDGINVVISDIETDSDKEKQPSRYFLISVVDLLNIEIELLPYGPNKTGMASLDEIDPDVPCESLATLGSVHKKCLSSLLFHAENVLRMKPLSNKLPGQGNSMQPRCILVTGPRGVGKSTLCRAVLRKLAFSEIHAYVYCLSCDSLRGKKIDTIKKLLHGIMRELVWRRPSILLLDDIDHLMPTTPAEAERTPDANYSLQISLLIKDCLTSLGQNNFDDAVGTDMYMPMKRVCVIATAASQHSIQPCLLPSSGCHLFSKIVNINLPDSRERETLVRILIDKQSDIASGSSFLDVSEVAEKTEGYAAHDFVRLSKIAFHNSLRRVGGDVFQPNEVMTEDYIQAQKGFVPISLQNAKLHDPEKLKWSDIGGMEDAKEKLKEVFIWPLKYKRLFKSSGINLHCGVLLYGPPGCGKTLLAGAVANECGLNFISVKGPELLNKYIGASEAAVRNIFAQASAAAPCILFFDEFDSIAPRRGHDSTGVTDRVVNQLLTHLDGIENLDGVQVLAATNRPDLIDPALLRPGRLDIHLHCRLPNLEERISILESLLRKAEQVDSVSIEAVASRCENFTGADLQALVYDAQLKALHGHRFGNDCCETNELEQNKSGYEPVQKSESKSIGYGSFKDQVTAMEIIESNSHRRDIFEASLLPCIENTLQDPSLKHEESGDVQDVIYFSSVHNKSEANEVLPEIISELAREYTKDQQENMTTNSNENDRESNECRIVIKRCCINQALMYSRPSISPLERMRYEKICLKFGGLFSSGKSAPDKDSLPIRQRATLA